MEDKTILGMWCTEINSKFKDNKHLEVELMAHIWYSYDNDSKTDVMNKKISFVKEIDINILQDTVDIMQDNKIEIIEDTPKKIEKIPIGKNNRTHRLKRIEKRLNEIIAYINNMEG